jgi:hypothetical protein
MSDQVVALRRTCGIMITQRLMADILGFTAGRRATASVR